MFGGQMRKIKRLWPIVISGFICVFIIWTKTQDAAQPRKDSDWITLRYAQYYTTFI